MWSHNFRVLLHKRLQEGELCSGNIRQIPPHPQAKVNRHHPSWDKSRSCATWYEIFRRTAVMARLKMHNVNPTTKQHQENPQWETLQRQLTCHLPKVQGQESQRKTGKQFQTRQGLRDMITEYRVRFRVRTGETVPGEDRRAGCRVQVRVRAGAGLGLGWGVSCPLAPRGGAWHSRYGS